MNADVSFSVDLILIFRCFAALSWGVGLAIWLQFSRQGQWVAEERTWLAVVIGVGVDLALAFGGDWLTCVAVIACSAFGIIFRSLKNEQSAPALGRNKTKWVFEDTIALTNELIKLCEGVIEHADNERKVVRLGGDALQKAHRANQIVKAARLGEYENGKA